jgi:lipoprotein signal peptidase
MKYLAPSINIEGGFVNFGFYQNYAGAFSLPIAGRLYDSVGIILLVAFGILFFRLLRIRQDSSVIHGIAASFTALRPRNDSTRLIAYGLIILGGASNIFDRLFYGYTIDYIAFLNFSFFNLADGMILAGIVLLLVANRNQIRK